jgi:hypothetical protein
MPLQLHHALAAWSEISPQGKNWPVAIYLAGNYAEEASHPSSVTLGSPQPWMTIVGGF